MPDNLIQEPTVSRTMQPDAIEAASFAIIDRELRQRLTPDHPRHPDNLSGTERALLYRMIHTSADFAYADSLWLSVGVLDHSLCLLRERPVIVTDTGMAAAGINKAKLQLLGGEVHCYISDPEVAEAARSHGLTRASVSMDQSLKLAGTGRPIIYAIGNAPTALLRLHELITAGRLQPDLIIGVPVGFVHVVEAKEMIRQLAVPAILTRGRKGGSAIAAAIVNALMAAAIH